MWFYNPLEGRGAFREKKASLPTIAVRWCDKGKGLDPETYRMTSAHLSKYAFFETFDKNFFYNNLLPTTPIIPRHELTRTVNPADLNRCVEHLLTEIEEKQKEYTHFTILQKKDFNRRKKCGLLIVQFKEYPFVLKLFIETPKTFINPRCKGFEPVFFFYMGGGINRHLSGFTRPKNLAYIRQKIADDPQWSTLVDLPRKWFWLPNDQRWFDIEGNNIVGTTKQLRTQIPGVYGIIADVIAIDHNFTIRDKHDRKTALALCTFLDLYVDPHIQNFMYEQKTGKILIVDTEHFPTIVGLKEKVHFTNYTQWYGYLMRKCAKDMLFSSEARLQRVGMQPSALALPSF